MRSLLHRAEVDQELDEEIQYHLQRQIDEGLAKGITAEEARRAALHTMGAITQNKEECRDMRRLNWIEHSMQDLRYGARALVGNWTFSIVAVLALALGIGSNTAMFSVAYGMLLKPLPYADADHLAVVYMSYFPRDFRFGTMSVRDYLTWKGDNRAFEDPSLFRTLRMDIAGNAGVPEQVQGASVTAGFFSTLGVRPLIGRTFAAGEDTPGSSSMAVLSESIWRRRFGASPGVLGQTILVNGDPSVIVGVMRESLRFPRLDTEIWTNLPLNPPTRYGPWYYRGVARMKPGVTLQAAQAELNNIAQRIMQQNPYYKRLTFPVLSLREALLGTSVKLALIVLMGAVGLVLLIAVVNVANLMLARATVREREMALRLSLGASRGRLVRQLLTESVLLAVMGGVAGLAFAWGGVALIRAWNPGNLPFIDSVRLDWASLGFMILVSVSTGVMFGLVPAFKSAHADLNTTSKEGGRASTVGPARGRTRAVLVISEIATSLLLLVGAGLLLRSFANLQGVTGGFSTPPRRILTVLISPENAKYHDELAGIELYHEILRKARNLPGVEMAALTDSLPPDRQGDADTFEMEGQHLAPGEMNPVVSVIATTSGLFRTLGVPLVKGRYFTEHDNQGSQPVAIVSEGFARRFFPNQEVLGKRIMHSGPNSGEPWMEIVGVVGNVKYLGLTVDTDPAYYMPFGQAYYSRMFLVVRSSGDAAHLAGLLRQEVQSIDRGVTLAQIGTMEQALILSVSQPRFDTILLALFAGIALVLAAVGIYGLISYSVAQRTHEMGVRMALGAGQADIVRMVVRQGVLLAIVGVGLGLGGAFALTHFLRTMLFGIDAKDPLTFAAAPLGMMVVVLLATSVPALRATRVSPLVALRK